MTDDYLDTMVQRHTDRYVTRYGDDPYTSCWPWAQAAFDWARSNENLAFGLRHAFLHDDDIEHLPAAIAETLRLNAARHDNPPGDLDLDNARRELGYWSCNSAGGYPPPGTDGWPEPTGPYADRWRAAFLPPCPERAERLARGADSVLHSLLYVVAAASPQRAATAEYRLRTYGTTYVALAEAAPLLGITEPVPVGDPRVYRSIKGLTAVPAPGRGLRTQVASSPACPAWLSRRI
ncbi:hypothetical protein [Streptomyces decoyicus]|uniref:hypothetical protein n=1 Tax=Streptomyces decoyicus TaxID=249567 RepID=UPI00386F3E0C